MNRRTWRVLGGILLLLLATAVVASAQGGKGSGGWGMNGAYGRLYNPSTVETVTGKVVGVSKMTPMKGMGPGIHLDLQTQKETVSVHLGPAWYLDRQDTRIEKGDEVEVTGSRVTVGGKPALIASEVKKNDQVLKLRDASGVPVWSGWRQGR
ncbi:DNA-binding protein [Geomonas sp.]|uniref:DNA-binding protein n=1 Tax=Geomonas sp. TaxID=2651584 RepID=UPI002B459A3F|nr:DNA-binding protein [Geomonas sp.]HJV36417.1 DNA-binding protein [Geomonas sp.]